MRAGGKQVRLRNLKMWVDAKEWMWNEKEEKLKNGAGKKWMGSMEEGGKE